MSKYSARFDILVAAVTSMDQRRNLAAGMRVLTIVWGALLGSVGLYVVVGLLVAGAAAPAPPAGAIVLRAALLVLGAVHLGLAQLLRGRLLRQPWSPPGSSAVGPQADPIMMQYSRAVILSLALAEAVAIYGLVLFLLFGHAPDLYLFTGAAAAALIWFRPSLDELEGLARAATRRAGTR